MKIVTFSEFKSACLEKHLDYYNTEENIRQAFPEDKKIQLIMPYSGLIFTYKNGKMTNVKNIF